MANTPQARKRIRQAEKRRQQNVSDRSMTRTFVKRAAKLLDSNKASEAQQAYQTVVPVLDRMAGKGIMSKNKAARHKSRLLIRLRKAGSEAISTQAS